MATPTVTSSSPPDDLHQYRSIVEDIVNQKNNYQNANGNQAVMDAARNQALRGYAQLPSDLATKLKGAGYQQAVDILNGIPKDPLLDQSGYKPPVNPNDAVVTDLLAKLTNKVNNPDVNPFDAQVASLIANLQSSMGKAPVDPHNTSEFTAAKASVDQQANDAVRQAQEALGASGFARSTNLAERAQGIKNDATTYLETQLVPQIAQQLQARDQQGLQNSLALLNVLGQQQNSFDERGQAQLQNLGALLTAATGQQNVFDTRSQNQFSNSLDLQDLKLRQQTMSLQERQQSFVEAQTGIENKRADLTAAIDRMEKFGYVTAHDAGIIGVPAGTKTFEAQNAIEQRKFELQQSQREIAAAKQRNDAQIAAEKANNDARIASSEKLSAKSDSQAKINDLLNVWQATGVAPTGLESLGIQAGKEYNPYLSPSEQIQKDQLDQKQKDDLAAAENSIKSRSYQKTYGLDGSTADALVSVLENPSYDSAIADFKAHEDKLRAMGINTSALKNAIEVEFKGPGGTKKSTGELEREFWIRLGKGIKNTYNSAQGYIAKQF